MTKGQDCASYSSLRRYDKAVMKKNRRTMCPPLSCFWPLLCSAQPASNAFAQEEIEIHFGRDIRPLLSESLLSLPWP